MKYCSQCGTNLKKLEAHRKIESENRETMRQILARENQMRDILQEMDVIRTNYFDLNQAFTVLRERVLLLEPELPVEKS